MSTALRALCARILTAQLATGLILLALAAAATAAEGRALTLAHLGAWILPLAGALGLGWACARWRDDGATLALAATGRAPVAPLLCAALCAAPWLAAQGAVAPAPARSLSMAAGPTHLSLPGPRGPIEIRWRAGVATRLDTGAQHPSLLPPAVARSPAPPRPAAGPLAWVLRLLCALGAAWVIWISPWPITGLAGLALGLAGHLTAESSLWLLHL